MNLLFVCSGNSCRSPMAMAVAMHKLGGIHSCDSAAGNLKGSSFKCSKNVASKAVEAIQTKIGEDLLSGYSPKPITLSLVNWADWILVLGEQFKENILSKFPAANGKTTVYGMYKYEGKEIYDIPDPFDGDNWGKYFLTSWPGKSQESYDKVAEAMINDFQPALERRLGVGDKPPQPKIVPGMK